MSETIGVNDSKPRRSGRRHRKPVPVSTEPSAPVVSPGLPGGRYEPLTKSEASAVIESALNVLERIGLGHAPKSAVQLVCGAGGRLSESGRLLFPKPMVEKAIQTAAKQITLPGLDPACDIDVGGTRVYLGVGGAAVQVLDSRTRVYRESTLEDLYRLGRVVDACDHIHFCLRPVVARDMQSDRELDLNTAYACLAATRKPIGSSFTSPQTVTEAVEMFDLVLGGEGAFRQRPVCFGCVCHVVPPLDFATEACLTMERMVELGMPLQIVSAGQAGATSPAALAGALVQGLAECLAGLTYVNLLEPGFPCIVALMPFISDLRTGAMTGGSGECAVASAAAIQLLRMLELPSAACAGMTDSKSLDAQAGYEKGYSVTLTAQAGANLVSLSCGMLGSIMAASAEAFVVDNDMHGAILRTLRGIEVSPETLSEDVIHAVVSGEGHFLGEAQTLALMRRDYLYPDIADRRSVKDWEVAGCPSLWQRAHERVEAILSEPVHGYLSTETDAMIRNRFPIRLAAGSST